MKEPFMVKHYQCEDRPILKGNGFDGLEIGKDREEAEEFVSFINDLRAKLQAALDQIDLDTNVVCNMQEQIDKLQAAEEALFTANRDRQGWEDEAKLFLGQRDALQAEVARLTSEVREWLCDSCNTIYPGPPQKGVWCVVCPKCGGDTAPTKTIELRKARTRIAELETAIRDWYIWAGNDDPSDKPLDRLNDTAKALLGEGE